MTAVMPGCRKSGSFPRRGPETLTIQQASRLAAPRRQMRPSATRRIWPLVTLTVAGVLMGAEWSSDARVPLAAHESGGTVLAGMMFALVCAAILTLGDHLGRHSARKGIAQSDARFRSLFENNHTVMLIVDPASRAIVDANPAAASFYGRTRDELMHMSIEEISTTGLARLQVSLDSALRSPSHPLMARHRKADGSIRDVEIHNGPFPVGDRALVYALIHDVTERRMSEDAQSRLTAILEVTPDLVSICDPAGRILYLNPAGRRMMNVESQVDVTRYNISNFLPDSATHPVTVAGLPGAARNGVWRGESELQSLDGRRVAVSQIILAHKNDAGELVFFSTITRDMTERRRTEEALRLQSAALNAAGNAMVIADRDGTIVWVNPAFTVLTGYEADEAVGKNPRVLLKSGVHEDALYSELWRTILAGRIWQGEMTNRRKDGTLYPEMQTITPVKDPSGAITHFVAIKRDLSEQRELEAQFLQSQKMEVVGRLAGGIAHDFNNLLTVINMTSELGADTLRQGDPLRSDFEEIGRAGQRAAALTRQLLAFSRRQILNPEVVNVGALIESMASMLQRLLGEDINLVVTAARDVPSVKADRSQLEQVVLNLAINARDAMPGGGTLTLHVRATAIAGVPHVVLAVTDTGTGMDETTRRRIFEPFFTTKEPGKGTGLGLSTVYGIVKQSGGTIAVDSALNAGTTFSVSLPSVTDGEVAGAGRRSTASARGTGTLLLVEDERALSTLASRMLKSAGYTVLTSCSGEDALVLLERHEGRIDLMITDVVMPGISGRELAARAARMRPGLRVLFTSGYTDDAILRHGVLEDLSHFIPKPYTRMDLTAKVRDMLAEPAPEGP